MDAPLEKTWWVVPGRLLAGPYPGEYQVHDTRRNARRLMEAGIRSVLNLMEAREETNDTRGRSPYAAELDFAAARMGVACDWQRFEIHDMSIPDVAGMDQIQAAIDASLSADRPVYAHCWGGRGRTGTVVGAWMIRSGLATRDDFVEVISSLRPGLPGPSPETREQIEFVRSYTRDRR